MGITDAHGATTVVVLDLDGTIIPDQEAFRAAAGVVLDVHASGSVTGEAVDELLVRARRRWRGSDLRRRPEALGVSSWEALWSDVDHQDATLSPVATEHAIDVWRDTLNALGADPAGARSAAQLLIRHREALVRPYPGAREALVCLTRDHRLWLTTHGSSSLQRRKLYLAGLEKFFDLILISADVGFLKHDAAFAGVLQSRLRRSALAVRAVVGDGDSDLLLAAHGGWPAIHIGSSRSGEGRGAVCSREKLADVPIMLRR